LVEGKLASADRVLQRFKAEIGSKEWQKGYTTALGGMLLASGSKSDQLVLMNRIGAKDADKFVRTFSQQSKSVMLSDFDRGFFAAWVDYTKALKDSRKT